MRSFEFVKVYGESTYHLTAADMVMQQIELIESDQVSKAQLVEAIEEAARLNDKEVHGKLVDAIATRVLRSNDKAPRDEIRAAL